MSRKVSQIRLNALKSALINFIDFHTLPKGKRSGIVCGSHNYTADDIFKQRKFILSAEQPFWKDALSDDKGNISEKRVDVLRSILMVMLPDFEYKPHQALLALTIIKQVRTQGVNMLNWPQDKDIRESWRTWLANLSSNVSQSHTLDKSISARYGVEDSDVVGLWKTVAEMWNKTDPVILRSPVGTMSQSGSWLARAGLLDIEHLEGLWPDFLTVMEERAKGAGIRKAIEQRGGDPELFDGILSLSKKKHLTDVARKNISDFDQSSKAPKIKM